MFHRIPLCCKYIWTTSSVCWFHPVSNLPSFLRCWETMQITDFGEKILRVLKKQPLPPTRPGPQNSTWPLKVSCFCTAPLLPIPSVQLSPSNFTNSTDQSPEPISLLKRSTYFVSLASSLRSLEQPRAPISAHIPLCSCFFHPSPAFLLILLEPHILFPFTIYNPTWRGFHFTWWNIGEQDKDHKDQE